MYAAVGAIDAARKLGLERPLENVARDAILEGVADPGDGTALIKVPNHGLLLAVRRDRSRFTPERKSWVVTAVRAA